MTAERQLYLALARLADEQGKQLNESPLADLNIPLFGADVLTVSMGDLAMSPSEE